MNSSVSYFIRRYRKAIGGAVLAGAAALVAALDHGSVRPDEWGTILGAIVAGGLGVALTPANAPSRQRRERDR